LPVHAVAYDNELKSYKFVDEFILKAHGVPFKNCLNGELIPQNGDIFYGLDFAVLYGNEKCEIPVFQAYKNGFFDKLKKGKIIYKKEYKNKNKEKRVSKLIPAEKSIEYRPKEANIRSVYGHWEGDLVVGKQGTKTVLFTLTERKTRQEIIMKLSNKETKTIARAIDKLERKYKGKFYSMFKSITFDNGVEFMGYKGIEKSCLRKKERTNIYYAHPYCSGERGTNENNNRLIRRFIPKGVDISQLKQSRIKEIEDWINNYPRKILKFKTSEEYYEEQIKVA